LDEVSLIIDILQNNWNASRSTLDAAGKLGSTPALPTLVDVRTLQKNRGVRYDLSAGDVIVVLKILKTLNILQFIMILEMKLMDLPYI